MSSWPQRPGSAFCPETKKLFLFGKHSVAVTVIDWGHRLASWSLRWDHNGGRWVGVADPKLNLKWALDPAVVKLLESGVEPKDVPPGSRPSRRIVTFAKAYRHLIPTEILSTIAQYSDGHFLLLQGANSAEKHRRHRSADRQKNPMVTVIRSNAALAYLVATHWRWTGRRSTDHRWRAVGPMVANATSGWAGRKKLLEKLCWPATRSTLKTLSRVPPQLITTRLLFAIRQCLRENGTAAAALRHARGTQLTKPVLELVLDSRFDLSSWASHSFLRELAAAKPHRSKGVVSDLRNAVLVGAARRARSPFGWPDVTPSPVAQFRSIRELRSIRALDVDGCPLIGFPPPPLGLEDRIIRLEESDDQVVRVGYLKDSLALRVDGRDQRTCLGGMGHVLAALKGLSCFFTLRSRDARATLEIKVNRCIRGGQESPRFEVQEFAGTANGAPDKILQEAARIFLRDAERRASRSGSFVRAEGLAIGPEPALLFGPACSQIDAPAGEQLGANFPQVNEQALGAPF